MPARAGPRWNERLPQMARLGQRLGLSLEYI